MTSFSEFLKNSVVGQEIVSAASEIVSFTNKNGKKFAYPIDDLHQCLQALWISSDTVQEIIDDDWRYEETKCINEWLRGDDEKTRKERTK